MGLGGFTRPLKLKVSHPNRVRQFCITRRCIAWAIGPTRPNTYMYSSRRQMGRENFLLCCVRWTLTASGCVSLGLDDCVGFLGQGAQNWLGNFWYFCVKVHPKCIISHKMPQKCYGEGAQPLSRPYDRWGGDTRSPDSTPSVICDESLIRPCGFSVCDVPLKADRPKSCFTRYQWQPASRGIGGTEAVMSATDGLNKLRV